jgi:hypothetical protein
MIFDHVIAYSANTVYEGASATSVLEQHVSFEDRAYRLWGIFVDQRFGVGRWAPLFLLVLPALPLLLRKGRVGTTVAALVLVQILIATFVAITMMGFWFPGRTLMVVLPLFALVLTNFALRVPVARLSMVALGLTSFAITASLYGAVHDGPYRLAVDPFDMWALPFRATAFLFPDYRAWDAGTVALTALWLVVLLGTGATLAYREFGRALLRRWQAPKLRHTLSDTSAGTGSSSPSPRLRGGSVRG